MLIIFIVVGVLGAAGFGYLALRGLAAPRTAKLSDQLTNVDIVAFLNLINPAEDAFLRRELSRQAYAKVRRMRIRAMLAYLQEASHNAGILVAYAKHGINNSRPEAAAMARQLIAAATTFQLLAFVVRCRLYVAWILPGGLSAAGNVMEQYEQLRSRLQRIVALDAPAASARIAAGM